MRTFIVVCLVALIVAVGMAFAVGLVSIATDQPEGRYTITLTVNTSMIHPISIAADSSSHHAQDSLDVKGKVTEVRPDKREFVVSENVKNWTFQLARGGKVFINDRAAELADLQAGDEATVTFDRQDQQLIANVVRSTRK
jgi:hypothetical protein